MSSAAQIIALLAVVALSSGCLLAAAGAVELDRHNHKATPPPSTPSASPEAGTAPASSGGTTHL